VAEQRKSPREVEGRDLKSPNREQQTLNEIAEDIQINGYKLTNYAGRWIIQDTAGNEIFAVIDNKGDYSFGTAEQVRSQYLDDAKKSKGGIEGLRKQLFDSKYISEGDFKTKNATAFNAAITNLGRDVANELWSSYESGIAWNTPLTTLLKSKSFTDEGPTASRAKTSRMQANQDINKFFMELVGFGPTKEQRKEYYELLDAAEKKALRRSTRTGDVVTTTDDLLDEEDMFEIRTKVLKPALKGTPLEQITAGGGKLAQQISDLKEYASEYGINLSTENALSQVKQQLKRGALKDLSQQQSQIREMSKAFYPNVADLIDKGVSIKDIADPFIQQKASTLDLPKSSISIFDNDIQKALNNTAEDGVTKRQGVMSISQSELMFRENPDFMRTKTAIDEAYSFISQLGRLFGKMA
jgi:hypothetical protein